MTSNSNRVTIVSLPPETLLNIFEHLDYWDLRLSIPLVCKLFDSLVGPDAKTKYGKLDKLLFRDAVQDAPPAVEDIRIHPIFDMINYDARARSK